MHKPYELVTKKSLQLEEGVKICVFVPIFYNLFNALQIHKLKMRLLVLPNVCLNTKTIVYVAKVITHSF